MPQLLEYQLITSSSYLSYLDAIDIHHDDSTRLLSNRHSPHRQHLQEGRSGRRGSRGSETEPGALIRDTQVSSQLADIRYRSMCS
jgi:hypothetical protein